MRYFIFTLILCSFLFGKFCYGQLNFFRNSSIVVLNYNGDTLKNAWAGGFNAVQFSEIDLNLDGIEDLFVFDRTGNRISTFINSGLPNQITYLHDPSYVQFFPGNIHDWVLLRDYNCDGKADIFTSSSGGIAVYKNTSTTQLNFTLEVIQLFSDNQPDSITPNFINLFVNSTDVPAIDDIDSDGDLDILISGVIGDRIEYHKNLSMEKNGNCDSLDFQIRNRCWGYVKENPTQNKVTFYDTCSNNIANPEKIIINDKHVGGTSLFTLDIDASNSKDLVIGGNTYDNLLLLINDDVSPNLTASSVSIQQSDFPAQNLSTIPLNLEHFPAGFYLDLNNDGVKDLICANNTTSFARNNNNVWYYNNNNATNNPDFNFITNSFLQEGMIEIGEGGYPTFFDHNSDGLMDIVVGGYGDYNSSIPEYYVSSLWLYENIGTVTNPSFRLIDSNYANVNNINLDLGNNSKTLSLAPTYGDIDGDGDIDMIIGDYIGFIHYFENTAGAGNTANFILNQARYAGIDVGYDATPQLIDLNRDLLLDLVIGNENGLFSYYENIGTASVPNFSFITDSLGKVSTRRFFEFTGNSVPFIYDDAGVYKMFSGAANGYIYLFENIDGNLTGTFSVDSSFKGIWEGIYSTVSLANINNDAYPDLLIGNYSGGASYYQGSLFTDYETTTQNNLFDKINVYPNPTNNTVNIDLGKNDISNSSVEIIDLLGKTIFIQNVVNNSIVVNLQGLSQGIYLIKFTNSKGSSAQKIIKH